MMLYALGGTSGWTPGITDEALLKKRLHNSKWCFTRDRAKFKDDKKAFVLCGTASQAEELLERKVEKKQKKDTVEASLKEAKQLLESMRQTEDATEVSLKKARKDVDKKQQKKHEADQKFKNHRGRPISFKDFLATQCGPVWASRAP